MSHSICCSDITAAIMKHFKWVKRAFLSLLISASVCNKQSTGRQDIQVAASYYLNAPFKQCLFFNGTITFSCLKIAMRLTTPNFKSNTPMGTQMGSGSESDNCTAQKQGMTLLHCTVAGTRWDLHLHTFIMPSSINMSLKRKSIRMTSHKSLDVIWYLANNSFVLCRLCT